MVLRLRRWINITAGLRICTHKVNTSSISTAAELVLALQAKSAMFIKRPTECSTRCKSVANWSLYCVSCSCAGLACCMLLLCWHQAGQCCIPAPCSLLTASVSMQTTQKPQPATFSLHKCCEGSANLQQQMMTATRRSLSLVNDPHRPMRQPFSSHSNTNLSCAFGRPVVVRGWLQTVTVETLCPGSFAVTTMHVCHPGGPNCSETFVSASRFEQTFANGTDTASKHTCVIPKSSVEAYNDDFEVGFTTTHFFVHACFRGWRWWHIHWTAAHVSWGCRQLQHNLGRVNMPKP